MAQGRTVHIQYAGMARAAEVKRIAHRLFSIQPAFKQCEIAFIHGPRIFLLPPMPRGVFISCGKHNAGSSLIQSGQQTYPQAVRIRYYPPEQVRQAAVWAAGETFCM